MSELYVAVPREQMDTWQRESDMRGQADKTPVLPPWSSLVADSKDRIFRTITGPSTMRPMLDKLTPDPAFADWENLALLREAGHGWPKNTTLLLKQNYDTRS